MKVLIFLRRWRGGVGAVVTSVKKELESKGNKVVCISREEDLNCFSTFKKILYLRQKYIQIINRERPDIIYTQDWSIALPLLIPTQIYRKNHFCCFHGLQQGKTAFFQNFVGKKLQNKLIVVGDSLKEKFPKSQKVYNGVDLEKFKPLNKMRNYFGWIAKEKEITEEEILILSKKLKLKPLIVKNYSIPFEKMNERFYNHCKFFVSLPPKGAGFNLCWIEAMAAGVPKIIGNDEGIGKELSITKIKKGDSLEETIKQTKEKNYRKEVEKLGLTWKNHTIKLLKIWKNE